MDPTDKMSEHSSESGAPEPRIVEGHAFDAYRTGIVAEAARQSALVARSVQAAEDQEFVDAVSEINPLKPQ
jgi:hypothetical protein